MISEFTLMGSLHNVERWGTVPHLRPISVAAHTFDVLWTFDWMQDRGFIYQLSHVQYCTVARAIMRHDMEEGLTGDMPSPVKRLGFVKENDDAWENMTEVGRMVLLPEHNAILKMADRLVMYREALVEFRLGNSLFKSIADKCRDLAIEAIEKTAPSRPDGLHPDQIIDAYISECPPLTGISHILETEFE